jgi:DNA-binding XRE family transcriptional regulator
MLMAEPATGPGVDPIEVTPVVVIARGFPARPSSIPDIRDFVRHCLAESPLNEEGNRQVGEIVFRALLDAAGPTGSIQVAFRIFPDNVEVDVLHSDSPAQQAGMFGSAGAPAADGGRTPAGATEAATSLPRSPVPAGAPASGAGPVLAADPHPAVAIDGPGEADTFSEWMTTALRREGLTQEAAARMLGVSVKTVSRWVGGATEPRLRDLRRIKEVFGQLPLP